MIFDNKKSSILQFVIDSICRTSVISEHAYALDSTVDVVNYVAGHRNAIGLIGVSLVSDSDDSTQMSFLKRIHVVALSKSDQPSADNSYKPYQAYIYQGVYPLTRERICDKCRTKERPCHRFYVLSCKRPGSEDYFQVGNRSRLLPQSG